MPRPSSSMFAGREVKQKLRHIFLDTLYFFHPNSFHPKLESMVDHHHHHLFSIKIPSLQIIECVNLVLLQHLLLLVLGSRLSPGGSSASFNDLCLSSNNSVNNVIISFCLIISPNKLLYSVLLREILFDDNLIFSQRSKCS